MLGQVKDNAGSLTRFYYLKDHLGDIKMVLNQSGGVDSYNDYYPFGMQMPGRNMVRYPDGRYKFTGKEQDVETTMDYGVYPALGGSARYYDSWRGQWLSVDKMGQWSSPYEYCGNNPARIVDPSGNYSYYIDGVPVSQETAESLLETMGAEPSGDNDKKKVAIDPGHGDKNDNNSIVDNGASNGETHEKDIALSIANVVAKSLSDNGIIAVQTRTGDVTDAGTKLEWRIDKADGCQIFVSIHLNSSLNPDANGFEVFYKSGNEDSKNLASAISGENELFTDRGTTATNSLYLLNHFKGTSVLVEAGFISNKNDLQVLQTNTAQVGGSIAAGIIKFMGGEK